VFYLNTSAISSSLGCIAKNKVYIFADTIYHCGQCSSGGYFRDGVHRYPFCLLRYHPDPGFPHIVRSQTLCGRETYARPLPALCPFQYILLDFASKFSPMCASTGRMSLGIIPDPRHILVYLEPENAHQSTGELRRCCTFLICRASSPLITQSQPKLL